MSAGAFERGIVTEVATPLTGSDWPEAPKLIDPAELLPDDALGFVAMSFNPAIGEWRRALGECAIADLFGEDAWDLALESIPPHAQTEWFEEIDRMGRESSSPSRSKPVDRNDFVEVVVRVAPVSSRHLPEPLARDATLGDALDIGLWAGSRLAGFDLEADLFDHLQGTVAAGVLHVDGDLLKEPLDAVVMLSYWAGSADALDETLERVASLLEDEFDLDFDPANVGAERRARLLDLRDLDDIGYAPGYVLHDGFLTFGTTEGAIEAVVSRQEGHGDALSSDDEYRRAVGRLQGRQEMLGYVNLQSIIDLVYDIDEGDLDRRMLGTLAEILGATAISVSSDQDVSRATWALTVFPEE